MGSEMERPVPLARVVDRLREAGLLVEAPDADVTLGGASDDSRRVGAGDLFCAWRGTASDSHDFVPAAAAAGAVAALVERRLDEVAIPQIVVSDGRRAAAHAASVVFGDPANELRLIGVTGTNGKTTTVWLLRHLLARRFTPASIGTLGVILEDGSTLPGSEALTTPGPVDMSRRFRHLRDRGVDAVAMEVSSHALDQGRVAALRFDVSVFTNLSRDHLDYHPSLEAYREAKLRLLDLLKPDGLAVVNADDPAWADVPRKARRALRFSVHTADADLRAEGVDFDPLGASFHLLFDGRSIATRVPLLGDYNIHNALGAAAACLAVGFGVDEVADALAELPQVPGRLERIAEHPCPVLRDYAHTPDALERALAALRPLTRGRLIVVFGAGGDRDRGKRPLMGRVAVEGADVTIVTSDNPRTEQPEAIIDDIVAGLPAGRFERVTDRRDAIRRALEIASHDDVVLLAGKGHETYQILGTDKVDFDEKRIVEQETGLLNGSAA